MRAYCVLASGFLRIQSTGYAVRPRLDMKIYLCDQKLSCVLDLVVSVKKVDVVLDDLAWVSTTTTPAVSDSLALLCGDVRPHELCRVTRRLMQRRGRMIGRKAGWYFRLTPDASPTRQSQIQGRGSSGLGRPSSWPDCKEDCRSATA